MSIAGLARSTSQSLPFVGAACQPPFLGKDADKSNREDKHGRSQSEAEWRLHNV